MEKKKKSKYMILILEERNGEYEYYHRSVHELLIEGGTKNAKKIYRKLCQGILCGKC